MQDTTPPAKSASFDDLLVRFQAARPVGSEDVIGALRALFEDVREVHDRGEVVGLDRVDLLAVNGAGELRLGGCPVTPPVVAGSRLGEIQRPQSQAVEIVRQIGVDEAQGQVAVTDRSIAEPGQMPTRPLFYRNYGSWELACGHHDALTDIFHLGLLMASLSLGLDFREPEGFQTFVQQRSNLIRLNPRLHAVLARAIADMTEPVRANRAADLTALIDLIDDYRSVEVDDARDKGRELEAVRDPAVRRQHLQAFFRNRLFEVTRRNKLLNILDAGECVGEMAYLSEEKRRGADVSTMADSKVITIPTAALESASDATRHHFDSAFLSILVERLTMANVRLSSV